MKLKKWFKKQIAAASIAFSNVEKNVLNQDGSSLSENTKQERRHTQGMLADSLIHGEVTQEVVNLRWRNYKILQTTKGVSIILKGYDENGLPIYEVKKKNHKKGLKKIKIDTIDKYKLEMVFNNNDITNNVSDSIDYYNEGDIISSTEYYVKMKTEKPLQVIRSCTPRYDIENYTKKVNIRTIDETNKLIEFYISKYSEEEKITTKLFLKFLNKIIEKNTTNDDFLKIDELGFLTNDTIGSEDFLFYTYKILSFDKIIEFDGYYVIKYKAEVIINGENILEKYREVELDKKYENKETKIKRPKDFNL